MARTLSFLPAQYLREMVAAMVGDMSADRLKIEDLFYEELTGTGSVSEVWVVTPKQVVDPLASYLQGRIRELVWGSESSGFIDSRADWSGVKIHPG